MTEMLAYAAVYLAIGAVLSIYWQARYADDYAVCLLLWPVIAVSIAVVWIHEFRRAPE